MLQSLVLCMLRVRKFVSFEKKDGCGKSYLLFKKRSTSLIASFATKSMQIELRHSNSAAIETH